MTKCKKFLIDNDIKTVAEFLQKVDRKSAQFKAPLFQEFFGIKNKYNNILPSENRGDYFSPIYNKYLELKVSFDNEKETLNLRQIRLYQDVDIYIAIYLSTDINNSHSYLLSKEQMVREVELTGKSLTHGIKGLPNDSPEYSITIPLKKDNKSSITKRWNENYRDDSILSVLLEVEK